MSGWACDRKTARLSGDPLSLASLLTCGSVLLAALAGTLPAAAGASAPDPSPGLELTLAECVRLALENNRDLAGQRLARLAQKLDLDVAEDEFRPILTFTSLCGGRR